MTAIPCVLMRGGTSRGPYLRGEDLPQEPAARDRLLAGIMGSGHDLQVDGIGGGHPMTSKIAIVSRSASRPMPSSGARSRSPPMIERSGSRPQSTA